MNRTRWASSRLSKGGLILLYHRVDHTSHDAFRVTVRPEHFSQHMASIRRIAEPISLYEMVAAMSRGEPLEGRVAVTFDDGYAGLLANALPVLQELVIPATLFFSSGAFGQPFWWDRLASRARDCEETEQGATTRAGVWVAEARQRAPDDLRAFLRELGAPQTGDMPRCMTRDELLEFASAPGIEIGAHTLHHLRLSSQTRAVQEREIGQSKTVLEHELGRPVVGFSYPFGLAEDYDAVSVEAVETAGFEYAVSNEVGVVKAGARRLHLPRLWVHDVPGNEFERRLRRWL